MAMMAITTNSSINVKPCRLSTRVFPHILETPMKEMKRIPHALGQELRRTDARSSTRSPPDDGSCINSFTQLPARASRMRGMEFVSVGQSTKALERGLGLFA